MTAIREYPFDLSDLQNQPPSAVGGDPRPAPTQPAPTQPNPPSAIKQRVSVPSLEGKRKVSIMADESSKDRENLPSDRYVSLLLKLAVASGFDRYNSKIINIWI